MVDLSSGEGFELSERANLGFSEGFEWILERIDEWKGSGMKMGECKIGVQISENVSDQCFFISVFNCLFRVMSRTDRMTSDLNRTGTLERDIEQVLWSCGLIQHLSLFFIYGLHFVARILFALQIVYLCSILC